MPGRKLGQRTWQGGSAVKGEKRKKNPCLCRTTSVLSGPRSDVTPGSIWTKGLHDLFNTRPCSLTQYQVSPPWCSGPCNMVEVKIWVSWSWRRCSTESMFCYCWLIWQCKVDVPVVLFHETVVRNVVHVKILLSQVILHMLTETWYLPGEQVDKPNVLPNQHPVGVVGGCTDAGQVRDSSWKLQGWLKSLHLCWGSHGGEEILYMVLQFWHLAVQ